MNSKNINTRTHMHTHTHTHIYIYIYIYIYIVATGATFGNLKLPKEALSRIFNWSSWQRLYHHCHHHVTLPVQISLILSRRPDSIVHCSQEAFQATFCIGIELLYIGPCWSSCLCSSMWRGPQEYITYEFVLTSPTVSRVFGSSNLDSFPDG